MSHTKHILLVEDDSLYYENIILRLSEKGYKVTHAKSLAEARKAINRDRYHLAIVDLYLSDDVSVGPEGRTLLREINRSNLKDVLPRLVFTAHADPESIVDDWLDLYVDGYIVKNTNYMARLFTWLERIESNSKINFDLVYDNFGCDAHEIATDIHWAAGLSVSQTRLTCEVQDLIGKLFYDALRVWISKMKPGLTGAAVLRVDPTWQNGVGGEAYVVKIGPREKILTEYQNYDRYVRGHLGHGLVTAVKASHTALLGALQYTFAHDQHPLEEFDAIYERETPTDIEKCVQNLFADTCSNWYNNPQSRKWASLPDLYYKAFDLTEEKLISRIQIILPEFNPQSGTFLFENGELEMTNPIAWLRAHKNDCVLDVHTSTTHGDLTGRNIMVNSNLQCWLIDFYRTYESHILRDFVILETDIKYRLMPEQDFRTFAALEQELLRMSLNESYSASLANLPDDAKKAFYVVSKLRAIARASTRYGTRHFELKLREYLLSLLMTTLNIVRLRHIDEKRKLQAMYSASLICDNLQILSGHTRPLRQYVELNGTATLNPLLLEKEATAQERYLAKKIAEDKVVLFIGSQPMDANSPSHRSFAARLLRELRILSQPDMRTVDMLELYQNQMGREALLNMISRYYQSFKVPPFFEQVGHFQWHAVYTTNQHTFLEEACKAQKLTPYVITAPDQGLSPIKRRVLEIYKLYGSIDPAEPDHSPAQLPLTASDFQDQAAIDRLNGMSHRFEAELKVGRLALCAYCSQEDLATILWLFKEYLPKGLVWLAGNDFSENQQDIYRAKGLRVIPEDPKTLLGILEMLI